jgi:hypothetical protein
MQPLSFLSRPGGQSLWPLAEGDAPIAEEDESVPDLDAVPRVPVVPSILMLVVLLLVAVLPAVLPLPLVAPLLAVLPLGVVDVPPDVTPAVVSFVPLRCRVVVSPDLLPPVAPAVVPPRLVVVVSEPLVLAAAPDWLLKLPLDVEVWAKAPAANKEAISVASNLLMGFPFQLG